MKKSSKPDIKKLIKEVLQERWSDAMVGTIRNLISTPRPASYEEVGYYDDLDRWEDDLLDDYGRFIGRTYGDFPFKHGDYIEPGRSYRAALMAKWNREKYNEKHNISYEEFNRLMNAILSKYDI